MKYAIWITALATGAIWAAMLDWAVPQLTALTGGEAIFDLRFAGYDAETARALLVALGEEGRDFYLNVQQRLDTAFPGLVALLLTLSYVRLFPRRLALGLSLVALIGAGFDYAENGAVAAMLRADPATVSDAMVARANRWTLLKSVFNTVEMVALLIGLVRAGWRSRRRRTGEGARAF